MIQKDDSASILFSASASERCYMRSRRLSAVQPILCKDSASERNESLLSNCRVQPILCKDSASERNTSLLEYCRAQPILCKDSKNSEEHKQIKFQL